jgi:outer membrane protein OmpA-like peptidoglycan-associated protein
VQSYDDSEVQDTDLLTVAEARDAIERTELVFPPFIATLSPIMSPELDRLAQQARRLLTAALLLDSLVQIRILGQADGAGKDTQNLTLSRQRAEAVAEALRDRQVPGAILTSMGLGVPQRSYVANTSKESAKDRRVFFLIELFSPMQPQSPLPGALSR